MYRDQIASLALWTRYYFGFEPKSFFGALAYKRRLNKAVTQYLLESNPPAAKSAGEPSADNISAAV
jgi:hypothetical protein